MKHWSKFIGLIALSFVVFGGVGAQYIQAQTPAISQEPQLVKPEVVVNVNFLNVRNGPSTAYTVLTVVAGGTQMTVLGSSSDGSWYQVKSPAGTGWVSAPFVLERGLFTHVPLAPAPELVTTNTTAPTIHSSPLRLVVNTGNLNVRTGPGREFTALGSVPGGSVLDVTGFAANSPWFRVNTVHGSGWVDSSFTLLRGNGSSLPVVYP